MVTVPPEVVTPADRRLAKARERFSGVVPSLVASSAFSTGSVTVTGSVPTSRPLFPRPLLP